VVLAAAIRKMEALQMLDLRKNHIGVKGFTVLSDAIAELPDVSLFLMADNPLSVSSKMSFDNLLRDDQRSRDFVTQQLKRHNLADRLVSVKLRNNLSLRRVDLSNCRVGDALLRSLTESLGQTKSLQSLLLPSNAIGDRGAVALAAFLSKNSSVTKVNLADNEIKDKGGAALAKVALQQL
jgi:Ran GTPase-activating protein (RanGAP) involved in mRNA processing and transport